MNKKDRSQGITNLGSGASIGSKDGGWYMQTDIREDRDRDRGGGGGDTHRRVTYLGSGASVGRVWAEVTLPKVACSSSSVSARDEDLGEE